MRFLRGGHLTAFICIVACSFVFAFMVQNSEVLKQVYSVNISTNTQPQQDFTARKLSVHQGQCEEELKRFWDTPIDKFKFGKSNLNCIKKETSKGSDEQGFEGLFVPENFKHLSECKPVNVSYYQTPHPKVALASFPGSGNTWARHLIEQMSGIYTGSVYCGQVRTKFMGECKHRLHNYTIVIKTHGRSDVNKKFSKAVVIMRNPYDTLFAEYNRVHAGKVGTISASRLNSKGWNDWVLKKAPNWYRHAEIWLRDFEGPLHLLSYEGMKNNFFQEMYSLASFLNLNVTYADLWCLKKNSEGSYHRKKVLEPVYSAEHRKLIDNYISEVKQLARKKFDIELLF